MISDERTWMQGGMPPTYGSPGRVGISQQQGGTGTLPSLSDRRTPDLEVLDRKVRQAAQHPSSSGRRSVGQQAGRRLSDRRGAAAPAALAIPPPPTYASRAHTAAEAGTGQLAGAAQLPERPYTTSVLHVAPQDQFSCLSPASMPPHDQLPSYTEPFPPMDYCPPPSRGAPNPGDSPNDHLFHSLYANKGLHTVSSQVSPVYRGQTPREQQGQQSLGTALRSLALSEAQELSWHASHNFPIAWQSEPPQLRVGPSKYQLLADMHEEERKVSASRLLPPTSPSQQTTSAPNVVTSPVSSPSKPTAGHRNALTPTMANRQPAAQPAQASPHGNAPNTLQNEAANKPRYVDWEPSEWQESLNEHQARIAHARAQGKIDRKLSPEVEQARLAAERMRQEKKRALVAEPQQLKANLQNPETKVGHQLDREIKSAWEQKRQEKDQMRKMLNKKASVESQVLSERLNEIESKVAKNSKFTEEDKARRDAIVSRKEAIKRRADMKLTEENDEMQRMLAKAQPRTQVRLTEEDRRIRAETHARFANQKYDQQSLKLQYDVAIELRRKMFRGELKVSQETADKIYVKGREASLGVMKMHGRAK
eukprot:jgi/Tetstr1/462345/TSEL_007351.t1